MLLLAALAALLPLVLLATTVNVYAGPVDSPVSIIGLLAPLAPLAVCPPELVTVYPVIVEPFNELGAVNVIDA
jgi:hypothetical protein